MSSPLNELKSEIQSRITNCPYSSVLWGIDLKKTIPTVDNQKETCILNKFLKAKESNAKEAADMLFETLKWRHEFKVDEIINETFPPAFEKLGYKYGKDKRGLPVTYNFYQYLIDPEMISQLNVFKRWRIQLMELAIQDLDFENGKDTLIQVHDYSGVGLHTDKRIKECSRELINIFQNHYPEFLYKKLFCGVPYFMEFLFNTVGLLVPKRTRDKFELVARGNTRGALLNLVDLNQIPSNYGGFTDSETLETKELQVPARQNSKIELIIKKGNIISWEFITKSNDIGVCWGMKAYLNTMSKEESGKGTFVAPQDGTFVLQFVNDYSLLTEKNVFYSLHVSE